MEKNKEYYVTLGGDSYCNGTPERELLEKRVTEAYFNSDGKVNKKYCNSNKKIKTGWIIFFILLVLLMLFLISMKIKNENSESTYEYNYPTPYGYDITKPQ